KIVVLKNNYRSFQGILDSASTLIAHNKQRLTFKYPQLDKSLIESRKDHHGVGNPPQLLAFANPVNHNFGVVDLIRSIHARGVPYHEIAVIYQKHKEAEDIIKFLSYENIPISIKRRVNILPLKEIKRILTLLNYFVKEMTMPLSMDKELFEILHYDFWGNKPLDLAILSLHISKLPKEERDTISWRKVIIDVDFLNKVGLKDPQAIIRSATIIEELFTDYNNHTIQTFFEMLMTKTGLYTNILLDSNKGWRLSVVNTFFDFIKKETANIPDTSLEDLLAKIDKMVDFDIALETNNIIYRNNGINFMTAHGSKGLEFEEVILLNTSQSSWKPTKSTNRVKFPDNMFIDDQDDTDEDYRRLFFVALTRAKNNVYLMYSKTDYKQKEVMVHQFVKELGFDAEVNPQTLDEEAILQYTSTLLKYDKGQISLIDKTLIDQVTENLVLNVTALNKYIKCPYTFYFENILRVPTARMATTGFGNAIHNALDRFILLLEGDPLRKPPSLAKLLDLFADAMVKYKSHFTVLAYENHLEEGKKVCQLFYDTYVPSFTRVRSFKTELELNAEVNGVPIKGNIDRIDIYDDRIEVLDYKTGSYYSSDFTKPSNDNVPGKNWRQGVFYQILIEQDNDLKKYPVNSIFHYLKPSQNTVKLVEQNEGYKNFVKEEIVKVYQSIKAHEFDHGCGKSDCQWCNFVKEHGQ
ncbi:MAG TPA: ATP-dependent DNA helicase, partial [Saprospiraceae bacterium]|nr:ATP-dependent DNA helicase [Saprospiraceae bacterium]